MRHIPALWQQGLRGFALCGAPATFATGDHEATRRLARIATATIAADPRAYDAVRGWCAACRQELRRQEES